MKVIGKKKYIYENIEHMTQMCTLLKYVQYVYTSVGWLMAGVMHFANTSIDSLILFLAAPK